MNQLGVYICGGKLSPYIHKTEKKDKIMAKITFQSVSLDGELIEHTFDDVPAGTIRTTTESAPEFDIRLPGLQGGEIKTKISGSEEKIVEKVETVVIEAGVKKVITNCTIIQEFKVTTECPPTDDEEFAFVDSGKINLYLNS